MIEVPKKPITIPQRGHQSGDTQTDIRADVHVFNEKSMWAIHGALGAQRPLLVRGEPGVGKTQLASAAAVILERRIVEFVVDSRTESQDLMWKSDEVRRLAEAQVSSQLPQKEIKERLHPTKFVEPGPLWWAFSWKTAEQQAAKVGISPPPQPADGWEEENGVVLLIDEIDKGESDVPNGLLEALGSRRFRSPDPDDSTPITVAGKMPLVIITTNEERLLPDAFVRRCLVLNLRLPMDETKLKKLLKDRGRAHFNTDEIDDALLGDATDLLIKDREAAKNEQITPLPGQAEFIDLLTALASIGRDKDVDEAMEERREAMKDLRQFVFQKHKESDE